MSGIVPCTCKSRDYEARCLGCDQVFKLCAVHWPLFTYCSPKCAKPHRKKLNEILYKPIRKGETKL